MIATIRLLSSYWTHASDATVMWRLFSF